MILDKEEYLKHINDLDQIPHMRRVLDLIESVLKYHNIESTDFYDPYTRRVAITILNKFEKIEYKELGGSEEAERKVFLIYPDYHYYTEEDSTIKALRITGNIEDLKHPDYLGAILNLGITRDKLGDIFIHDNFTDIIVKEEIKNFISLNLNRIKNIYIDIKEIDLKNIKISELDLEIINRTINSLRLDAFISAAYNLSRDIGQRLVELERVKVNHEPIDKTSFPINEGDLISVSGYGRSYLKEIKGLSRKDRYIIEIAKVL